MRSNPNRLDAVDALGAELAREERSRSRRRLLGTAIGVVLVGVALLVGVLVLATPKPRSQATAATPLAVPAARVARPVRTATATTVAATAAPLTDDVGANDVATRRKVISAPTPTRHTAAGEPKQRVSIAIGGTGYQPSRVAVRAGAPVVLTVAKGEGCAAGFEIPELGVHMDNSAGPATKSIGRLEAGTYKFTCSMGMVRGDLVAR